ncbi:MAG: hypothetical protein ACK5JD_08825 [Mangrovibacterium sp.]
MEDYIFIIIAILLSAFGAINRKKKERAKAMEQDDEQDHKSVFADLFDDDFLGQPNTVPSSAEKPAPKPKAPKKAPQPVQMEAPAKLGYTPLQRESLTLSHQRPERKSENLQIEELAEEKLATVKKQHPDMNGFSLRKAVIYAEILQRKF